MTNQEIKSLSDKELQEAIAEKRLELTRMRMNNVISPIENPKLIEATRRMIARMLTEVNRRRHQAAAQV